MTSFSHNLNPRANVFILVNLGCEMLFVIDQRLKAQQIAVEKSIQVIHDVTAVLLEPKFIDSLIVGSTQPNAQLFTEEHCKFMLKDIATCSLMRLDDVSMDKLWNLMTMIYKWQLFHTRQQHHLMDITFRHLQAISSFYPEEKRTMLIDFTKNTLLDFWNSSTDIEQHSIYMTNITWLELFNTKISLLIRLGFQALDGSFFEHVDAIYYQDFKDCIGDNIYIKSAEIAELKKEQLDDKPFTSSPSCVDQLAEMLNFSPTPTLKDSSSAYDDFKPINVNDFQRKFEQNLQQCNILFEDLDVNGRNYNTACSSDQQTAGFVHLNPIHNRTHDVSAAPSCSYSGTGYGQTNAQLPRIRTQGANMSLNKDLMDLYAKIN